MGCLAKGLYKYLEPKPRNEEKEYVIRNSNENYYRKSENLKLKNSKNQDKKLKAKAKSLNEREEDLNKREDNLMNEKRQFEFMKDKLKKENDDIEKKKKDLKNKEIELNEKEGAINNKENKLNKKEGIILNKEKNINEKEESIKKKEAELLLNTNIFTDKNNELEKKMKELIEKENDLNKKLNELNIKYDQMKKKDVPILIGLNNIGATCYMNASLQCFSNTKKLTQYFLEHYEADPKNTMANEYFEVLKNLWNIENNNKSYSPNSFKDILSKENPLFAGIQANDSKDLINFLLERFHQELNLATKENGMDNEALLIIKNI